MPILQMPCGIPRNASKCTKGKIRVVFGCGGDRDKGKRLEMTRVACAAADQIWATSDNPHAEVLILLW